MKVCRPQIKLMSLLATASLVLVAAGCTRHTVDVQPIRVEPIHLTVDVNVKVDRELDEFFDFEEQHDSVVPAPVEPATEPPADLVPPPAPTAPSTMPEPVEAPPAQGGLS